MQLLTTQTACTFLPNPAAILNSPGCAAWLEPPLKFKDIFHPSIPADQLQVRQLSSAWSKKFGNICLANHVFRQEFLTLHLLACAFEATPFLLDIALLLTTVQATPDLGNAEHITIVENLNEFVCFLYWAAQCIPTRTMTSRPFCWGDPLCITPSFYAGPKKSGHFGNAF